jgi:hypothetical protein
MWWIKFACWPGSGNMGNTAMLTSRGCCDSHIVELDWQMMIWAPDVGRPLQFPPVIFGDEIGGSSRSATRCKSCDCSMHHRLWKRRIGSCSTSYQLALQLRWHGCVCRCRCCWCTSNGGLCSLDWCIGAHTAPEMITRGKPRDFAKLRQSLGYLRYLFISRMVRPISEHLFFSASTPSLLCHKEPWTDIIKKTFSVIISFF